MIHLSKEYGQPFNSLKSQILEIANVNGRDEYIVNHSSRLAITALRLKNIISEHDRVLEIGFSDILHKLADIITACWDYTSFPDAGDECHPYRRPGCCTDYAHVNESTEIVANLETDILPVQDSFYDLVISTEVIEHMDVDPMFHMSELNRALRLGGRLFLTTPNSSSNRIIHKVLSGSQPSFYMVYSKDRNPYRHNFEYSPDLLSILLAAAGFSKISISAIDTFNEPVDVVQEWIQALGFNPENRGDNIFATAIKTSAVVDRFPGGIYG